MTIDLVGVPADRAELLCALVERWDAGDLTAAHAIIVTLLIDPASVLSSKEQIESSWHSFDVRIPAGVPLCEPRRTRPCCHCWPTNDEPSEDPSP